MTMQSDIELRLRGQLEAIADRSVRDGQVESVLARTSAVRQRPAWVVALRSPTMTDIALTRPAAPRAFGLIAVLALMAVALAAAYLLAGRNSPSKPINGQIVVGRMNEDLGDTEVFIMNPDGTHERQLLPGLYEGPFWSPDGTRLGLGHAMINADGTGFHAWDQSGLDFNLECWDWSPDGERMLCEGFTDGDADAQVHGVYRIAMTRSICMAEIEHPEQYNWWLNELDSLGISTLEKNGINNRREASDLTDAVKQTLYEEYLHQAYSGK
jgi:hypothetical protein